MCWAVRRCGLVSLGPAAPRETEFHVEPGTSPPEGCVGEDSAAITARYEWSPLQ